MNKLNRCHPRMLLSGFRLIPAFAGMTAMMLLFVPTTAFAATYDIDAAHSNVEFKIRHLVGKVAGHFNEFEGTIEFDAQNEAVSVVKVKIDVDSIDTHNANRDMHLKTADFFDSSNFKKISFSSKKVDAVAKKIIGDLTMHGVTKEVELDYTFEGTAPDRKGFLHLGGTGQTVLHRKDFGITYDPTGAMIGDDVQVQIDIEAIQRQSDTQ